MFQHTLHPKFGSRHKRKRVGRGNASGHGTFSGRGVKGQKARSGGRRRPGFEGGQTPLSHRMPKLKGFTSHSKEHFMILNTEKLNIFENNSKVDLPTLYKKKVKVLGTGEVTKNLEVHANAFSKSAVEKIEKAGGKTILVEKPQKHV